MRGENISPRARPPGLCGSDPGDRVTIMRVRALCRRGGSTLPAGHRFVTLPIAGQVTQVVRLEDRRLAALVEEPEGFTRARRSPGDETKRRASGALVHELLPQRRPPSRGIWDR